MVVAVGLAFLNVDILPVAVALGTMTFMMVTAGVMLGREWCACGRRTEAGADLVLIAIGTAILIQI